MRIRLIDPGYEKFSGPFGQVEFVDGVSVEDVSQSEARFLAALVRVEEVDTGLDPGDNAKFSRSFEMSAPIEDPLLRGRVSLEDERAALPSLNSKSDLLPVYTRDDLEKIADQFGIAGLREIADPIGVKNTSIVNLIDGILGAQVARGNIIGAVALQSIDSTSVIQKAAE